MILKKIPLSILLLVFSSAASFGQGIVTRPTKPKTVQNNMTPKKKVQSQQSLNPSEMLERGYAAFESGNYFRGRKLVS